jgi:ectoine hydroxylase-related dioxygenase (phytanoyl-CoA dioxygenase family)
MIMNSINEHFTRLDKEGYTIIPNLISRTECESYKSLLDNDYKNFSHLYANEKKLEMGSLANKIGEKVVFNLHNKNYIWFKLFDHPEIMPLLDLLLKEGSYKNSEPYYLYNISARSPLKGNPSQQLHSDSNLPGINYCIIANVLWALDEFTLENGATRVVPGSHRFRNFAPDGIKHPDEISITAPQGSAIIFNANLWHGGAANNTNLSRWALALGYARWFIKPSFDFLFNTPKNIYNQMSDDQKRLLGFNLYPPKDEFTGLRRRQEIPREPFNYNLPSVNSCK